MLKSSMDRLIRLVPMLLALFLAAFALSACAEDDGQGGGPEQDGGDEPSGWELEGTITVGENTDRIVAEQDIRLVGRAAYEPATDVSVTASATWANRAEAPTSGDVSIHAEFRGLPDRIFEDFTLVEDVGTTPPEEAIASLMIDGAIVNGVPMKLISVSGTLDQFGIGTAGNTFLMLTFEFNGTFKNADDLSDTTEYPLTGSVSIGDDNL